ncbi:MAG: hypothetical protein JKX84_04895 [Flavobacteriales bacterium]|nr:hypothetical protein [Flavobacteriales bacterium]
MIVVLVYLQGSDNYSKWLTKKRRRKILLIIAILSIVSMVISFTRDNISQSNQEAKYDSLLSTYSKIQLELEISKLSIDSLSLQNDSLKALLYLLREDNHTLSNQIVNSQSQTIYELKLNRGSIDQLGKLAGARTITQSRIKAASRVLSKSKGAVYFTLKVSDSESINFTELLKTVFKNARWKTTKSNGYQMSSGGNGPLVGLQIIFIQDDITQIQVATLQEALTIIDVPFRIDYVEKSHNMAPKKGWFNIYVGAK